MKTKMIFTLLVVVSLIAASCNRNNDDPVTPDTGITSVTELVVPADFDWRTTQTVEVTVQLPETGALQPLLITTRDGSRRFFRGFPEDGSRTLHTKITVPAIIKELKLTYSGTVGPNIVYLSNAKLDFDFNTSKFKSTETVGCNLDGFLTYSKGGWGQRASGNNCGTLRDEHFDDVYPVDFIVGDPDHYTIIFNRSSDVKNYLPGGGTPQVLTHSYVNPGDEDDDEHLGNMADQIIAARLNRDFSEAGFLGTNEEYHLGELILVGGPFANMSVDDFLEMAETALGGGGLNGFTPSQYSTAAESIALNFEDGDDGGALTCPAGEEPHNPYIEVSSECDHPDVIFTISNTGDGDMTSALAYTLYKNNVEIESGTYLLEVNETLDITETGYDTDEFRLNVVIPNGNPVNEILSGCGNEEEEVSEQLEGTLAYEDLWPGKGDYDFNDLIIDYDFVINKNAQEIVQSINATFVIKAYGASYHNGFGFSFPDVSPEDIISVTGANVANTTVFDIAANGTENGQTAATIILYDDSRRIMPQTNSGIGVNTQLEYDFVEPVTMTMTINFANNAVTYSQLNIGEFNPFIIVNTTINDAPGARGLEVHLPNYAPTDLFDESYIGQLDDDSSIAEGRYFVTALNHPWAINIADGFDWVIEFQDITGAYLMFAEWAQSGGTNYPDWYIDQAGYRNDNLIYPTQIGN